MVYLDGVLGLDDIGLSVVCEGEWCYRLVDEANPRKLVSSFAEVDKDLRGLLEPNRGYS